MGAQGGQNVHLTALLGEGVVINVGDIAGVGMETREVRRYYKYVFKLATFKRTLKQTGDFLVAQALGGFCGFKNIHLRFTLL
jgi:hypothetical protein